MDFKKGLFATVTTLLDAIEGRRFTTSLLRDQIGELASSTDVSFGQAQKAVNVILKFHFYLTSEVRSIPALDRELDCPVDSNIQDALKMKRVPLSRLKRTVDCH